MRQFIESISRLDNHVGPFLVQFPTHLEPGNLPLVKKILSKLPEHFQYVLELRHLQFFRQPQCIEPLLEKYGAGLVMFDSRPIYEGHSNHPEVLAGKHKKPKLPVLNIVYNQLSFVRLILHPDAKTNSAYIDEWVVRVTQYLNRGDEVFFMVHCLTTNTARLMPKSFISACLPTTKTWHYYPLHLGQRQSKIVCLSKCWAAIILTCPPLTALADLGG